MAELSTLGSLLVRTGGSIKTGPFGTALKAAEYADDGAPVISVGEVGHGRLRLHARTPRVAGHTMERLSEYVLRHGDVVFGRKGAVDRSAWVKEAEDGYFLGSDGIRVRFGSATNARFMAFQFQMRSTKEWLAQHAAGTTMPSLNQRILERLPVVVPHREVQDAIAEVLGALDDKIDANAKGIDLADHLSKAQFRAAAAVGSEVPLSSMARFVNGKAYTKDATGTGRVVVRIAELNSGIGASTVRNDIEVPEDNTARPGDLLFAWSGSLTAARWYRPEAIVNQHIFKVIPNDGTPMWLVNQAVHEKLDEFKAIAADKATTMGHIQRRHLDEPVRVPSGDDIKRLDELMTGLWETALALQIESLKLTATRDELLPLLMSGKVHVKDAEKTVEGVL